jgi:hypothetical protein
VVGHTWDATVVWRALTSVDRQNRPARSCRRSPSVSLSPRRAGPRAERSRSTVAGATRRRCSASANRTPPAVRAVCSCRRVARRPVSAPSHRPITQSGARAEVVEPRVAASTICSPGALKRFRPSAPPRTTGPKKKKRVLVRAFKPMGYELFKPSAARSQLRRRNPGQLDRG